MMGGRMTKADKKQGIRTGDRQNKDKGPGKWRTPTEDCKGWRWKGDPNKEEGGERWETWAQLQHRQPPGRPMT